LFGVGVDDAGADAVEAAGDLVAAAAELAAGVEDGHDGFDGALAGLLLVIVGYAAAVVVDRAPAVGADDNLDAVAVAGHRFVDGVVDEFFDEVVETGLIGRADVHAGAPADGFEAFQHLDVVGGV